MASGVLCLIYVDENILALLKLHCLLDNISIAIIKSFSNVLGYTLSRERCTCVFFVITSNRRL